MQEGSKDTPAIRTIRAADEQLQAILDKLDSTPVDVAAQRRTAERYQYRHKGVAILIQQPGDAAPKKFVAHPRDLSEGGMAFLHGGFVHVGSKCCAQLITMHGSRHDIDGTVVGCTYIDKGLHEIRMKFTRPIEPCEYCSAAIRTRVLVVDDDPAQVRLTEVYLTRLNAEVDQAPNGKAAIEKTEADVYDLILMDLVMPEPDGLATTRELRRRGYPGLIVAMSALSRPEDKQRSLEAGCNNFLAKPITLELLASALKLVQQEPLFSTFGDDPAMEDLIRAFVFDLPKRVRAIEESLAQNDNKRLEELARALKAEGTSYGFEIITATAAKVEQSLITGAALTAVRRDLDELVKLCMQVRIPPHFAETSQALTD